MSQKIYYLTTEIIPFAEVSPIAEFSTKIPLMLQGNGHDIRTIIPKYGFISERKYILREVIRLREIPFEFAGEDKIASAKSAFIPKTRVQVYFLEDDHWFKPLTNLLYKAKNGRILADNGERYGYFAKAVFIPNFFAPITSLSGQSPTMREFLGGVDNKEAIRSKGSGDGLCIPVS